MTDQAPMLFAQATMLLEDLHGISVEGQRHDHSPDMRRALLIDLRAGAKRLTRLAAKIGNTIS